MAALRKFIVNLLATSDYRPTRPSLRNIVGEKFGWSRQILIEVNLPREQQLISDYPDILSRIVMEFPQLSASCCGITCGQDRDFVREIEQGEAGSLGHLWEHIAAQLFDDVSSKLGYGDHDFVWYTRHLPRRSNKYKTVYEILCLHEVQPPAELNGLESLATGYLNALLERQPFSITERIKNFIDHRTFPMGLSVFPVI